MTGTQAALVWCPFPDRETARSAAEIALSEKLVACANIFPEIESLFIWAGAASNASECAALFKTTADKLDVLIIRLGELHPYDTPAIVGWRCDAALPATLQWLGAAIGNGQLGD